MSKLDEEYVEYLISLGFDREKAETIAEGRNAEVLPEDEFLGVAHCLENDRVDALKPLVEKYGWYELFRRFHNSAAKR